MLVDNFLKAITDKALLLRLPLSGPGASSAPCRCAALVYLSIPAGSHIFSIQCATNDVPSPLVTWVGDWNVIELQ
jgi:hypothetical protein